VQEDKSLSFAIRQERSQAREEKEMQIANTFSVCVS